MKLILPPLAVLTLTGWAVADSSPSRLVEMEIVDTPKQGAAHTTHFAMAVVEDRGWFTSKTNDEKAHVHASARIDRDQRSNVNVLDVEVQRQGASELDIHGAKVVGSGLPRSLVGRVERENGVSEVFVTIR